MSAAARAEARRKAILSRGTDRLAKLTTSGRGEDAAYAKDVADPPLPSFPPSQPSSRAATPGLSDFLGESTPGMLPPRPRTTSTNTNASSREGTPDPSAWTPEQQAQFMQALMGGGAPPSGPGGDVPGMAGNPFAGPGMDGNPFAALMAAAAGGGAGGFPPSFGGGPGAGAANPFAALAGAGAGGDTIPGKAPAPAPPKTRAQRLMPLVHLGAVWALLTYFVVYREPLGGVGADGVAADGVAEGMGVEMGRTWRWKQLAKDGWGVQTVPFFWAFVTLELVLHSLRIFSGFDAFRPPTLLALALPHLPPPIPSLIVHSMKYAQMGSLMLDDVAAAVVGVGLVVWLSSWL